MSTKAQDQESEMSLLDYIDGLIPENGHLEFDFTDARQYEFAVANTKRYFDTARYPGLLKTLELRKEQQAANGFVPAMDATQEGFATDFMVTGVGRLSSQNAVAANGIGTVAGGYLSLGLMLFIKDNATGKIIANGSNRQLTGSFLPVATTPSQSGQGLNVTSYLQYNYTPTGGGSPVSGIVKQGTYNTEADPVVTQPVAYCTNPWVPGAINIGLGRPWGDPELGTRFDYIWAEPTNNSPTGKIPFVGSVVFNQPIQSLQANSNFLLSIDVANGTGGGTTTLSPTDLDNVYKCFSIDPVNPNKLNWKLPAGTGTGNPGNPITFSNIPWPSDMKAYFYCQILVTLADGSFGSANVQSQTTTDNDPLDGNLGILPISFVWHCLAEDTLVTMADGSQKPIGEVVGGDRVRPQGDGEASVVGFTTRGAHQGRALRITVDGGRSIVSSSHHVFVTPQGFAPAATLQTGDQVAMGDGWSSIASLDWLENPAGMFCNLALVDEQGRMDDRALAGFLANDFKVGDLGTQQHYRQAQQNDKEWVKRQVPEYLHEDVEAYFEDMATSAGSRR